MEDISACPLIGQNKSEIAWICMDLHNGAIGSLLLPG